MRLQNIYSILTMLWLVSLIITAQVVAQTTTPSSKKWKIIYVEGGNYTDYQQILAATARNLAKLGLIDNGNVPIPKYTASTKPMWQWLAANAGGDQLEFLADGYYSANWDKELRIHNKQAILERIKKQNDVDMIFAYGTMAGLDMATAEHTVPTFSMSVTDAVQAGISKSTTDSGLDHVHAQIELGRYERQLAVFYEIFKFKRLGLVYEDTPEGRATVALPSLENTAAKLNVELVRCTTSIHTNEEDSFNNLKQCLTTLAKTSDAVFLTINAGMQWNRMSELLQPLFEAGLPTFSQSGPYETKLGVLMSLAQRSFDSEGSCGANAIAAVLQGSKPRAINQIFISQLRLAINLKTAALIAWDPSLEVLVSADNIYYDINNPEQ